jgi:ATP-dependent helicase/nuclease subunit B
MDQKSVMIKHIPLNQNILQSSLKEIDSEKCLLLFPTRKSKREAQKLYQPSWDFSEHQFLTMDEWKESLFVCSQPILKEEKRTLSLYQSLSPKSKEFFKIKTYHQSIEFAHNFFGFWEEIQEELVENESITEVLSTKQSSGNWQLNSFEHLLQIKQDYQKLLQKIDFSDTAFIRNGKSYCESDFSKIIVVNQFYFTNFEKKLLSKFENKVVILSQIPIDCFDDENLKISPEFNASHIKTFISNKIQVHTSSNQMQMIAQLATELAKTEQATLIDFQFEKQPYSHLLSNEHFSKSTSLNFSNTRFFHFFQVISEMLNSIIWEGQPFLISIQSALALVSNDDLLGYFVKNTSERESIRAYIFKLINNDFKYLDLEFIQQRKSELVPLFENIFRLLQNFRKISSIRELIKFININIDLEYLLTDLQNTTNIAEVFYESLADFNSIEVIELIGDWKEIFPAKLAENLLKLFLDYLKPKKLKFEQTASKSRFDITTLQDTRNLEFENLYVLNVVEGVLPDRKHTQFLLSENQRKELGLKTYEDITIRDKFYFYRLICNCKNANVFTRYNLEENIEISSFLEELKLHDLLEEKDAVDFSNLQKQLFNNLFETKILEIPNKHSLPENFYSFPFDKSEFPDNKLNLSFYKWEKLKINAFEFYLEFVTDLKKREAEIGNDFSSKLIGTISHEIITLVWKRLIEVYQSNEFKHNFINNTKLYVEESIQHYLKYNRDFHYISPHNFSDNYFQKIFLPVLADGIENFFYRLHNDLQLSEKSIIVFPETEQSIEKKYTDIDDLEIYLKGRPDLRIHTANRNFIFDFKTGNSDYAKLKRYNQQLQFYENISYLIDLPAIADKLKSYLFFVEQKDLKALSKRVDLKDEITERIVLVMKEGFRLSEKKDKYEETDITRRDLQTKGEEIS